MIRGLLAFALVILATCLASFALPCAADAQQAPSRRRIGVLFANLIPEKGARAFLQGLQDAGYSEGRDVVIEWHSANGDSDRLSELAAGLVRRKVDVIVGGYAGCPGGQTRHLHHPYRHGAGRRSSRIWLGGEPGSSWWQRHWALADVERARW